MPVTINNVVFTGYTTDQVTTHDVRGKPVANFTLGHTRRYKKADNTTGEETSFLDCELYGPSATTLAQYAKKGTGLYVEGRLKMNSWTKDNQKHSKVVIIVSAWQFNDKNQVVTKEGADVAGAGEDAGA
jgi:single-strand DNA-binding protein